MYSCVESVAVDAATLAEIEQPYVASDGFTYEKETLLSLGSKASALIRSPNTREVLRPVAFPQTSLCPSLTEPLQVYNEVDRPYNVELRLDLTELPPGPAFDLLFQSLGTTDVTLRLQIDFSNFSIQSYDPLLEFRALFASVAKSLGIHRFENCERIGTCVCGDSTMEKLILDWSLRNENNTQ